MLRGRVVTIAFLFVATGATFDDFSCCYYLASKDDNKFKSVWSGSLTKNASEGGNGYKLYDHISGGKMDDGTCWDQSKVTKIWNDPRRKKSLHHEESIKIEFNDATYMCCPRDSKEDARDARFHCFLTKLTVGCITSEWSAWGECDKTCGPGKKSRTRKITAPWENNPNCDPNEEASCDNECDAGLGIFGLSTVATIFLVLGTALVVIIIISIVVLMCCLAEKEEEEEEEDTGIDGDILFL